MPSRFFAMMASSDDSTIAARIRLSSSGSNAELRMGIASGPSHRSKIRVGHCVVRPAPMDVLRHVDIGGKSGTVYELLTGLRPFPLQASCAGYGSARA